jgi:cell division protein FtsZ
MGNAHQLLTQSLTMEENHMMQDVNETFSPRPVLKVLGLGGGGCNAVERMIELGLEGVEYIAANTDRQTLETNPAEVKVLLGRDTTRGLGAGGDPKVGRAAARESSRDLAKVLAGADMVFLTAGMGGGTGTGAIPVAAEIARTLGAVTVAIVTMPFSFEVGHRQKNANEGLKNLREYTHTLVAIPNDRLLYASLRDLPVDTAFRLADDVLRQSVQGIAELITQAGMINVDFSHIKRLIEFGGGALMSIGQGQGPEKAKKAVEQALNHPLLEGISLENAAGVIANFTGGSDLGLFEVHDALESLRAKTGSQTDIVLGVINDKEMERRVQVILMITGLGAPTLEETMARVEKPRMIEDAAKDYAQVSAQSQGSLRTTRSTSIGGFPNNMRPGQ